MGFIVLTNNSKIYSKDNGRKEYIASDRIIRVHERKLINGKTEGSFVYIQDMIGSNDNPLPVMESPEDIIRMINELAEHKVCFDLGDIALSAKNSLYSRG